MRIIAYLLMIVLSSTVMAQNNNWPMAIAAVSESAAAYQDYAEAKSGNGLGGMVGQIGAALDIERHSCAILGRMLGRLDEIAALEKIDYPTLNNQLDDYEAAMFASSLKNWVGMAKWALALNEADRINRWNLDCVGQMGIPASAPISHESSDALFAYDRQTGQLTVYGDIDTGFYDRFLKQLVRSDGVKEVLLGSGGGSVRDAIMAGREIRKRNLDTTLSGNCYSACPLVFAGGKNRTVWAVVRHDFGFHQVSLRDGEAVPDDHPVYETIAAYLTEMGVDAQNYLSWMYRAPPTDMYIPDIRATCAPKLVTFVQRICADGELF